MEIADIFVVNKADRDGADRVVQSIAANLSLQTFEPGEWKPPILETEATAGAGVSALWTEIGRYRDHSADRRTARQRSRQEARLRDLLAHRFVQHVESTLPPGELAAPRRRSGAARGRSVHGRRRRHGASHGPPSRRTVLGAEASAKAAGPPEST